MRTSPFSRRFVSICTSLSVLALSALPVTAGIITVGDTGVVGTTFFVGQATPGTHTLTVDAGSVLDSAAGFGAYANLTIASFGGVSGTATVSGVGSRIVTTGSGGTPHTTPGLFVGGTDGGVGTLNVLAGGSLTVNRFDTAGASRVRVEGSGSTISSASTFNIGGATGPLPVATGIAEIVGGAVVSAQTSSIGALAGSSGKLTVTGPGSALNLVTGTTPAFGRAFLNVGREQTGELNVLAGGKVLIEAAPLADGSSTGINLGGGVGTPSPGGFFANGEGILAIDGTGSELRIRGSNPVSTIGRQGSALVNITGGGKFITENTAAGSNSFVGRNPGGTGTVNVTGTDSEWQAGRRLYIGSDAVGGVPTPGGTGTVKVADGGRLSVGGSNSFIAVGGGGTLTGGGGTIVGNLTSEGMLRPGNSTGIMTIVGNLGLGAAGTVELELGGTSIALAQYDQVNAYDNAATPGIEGSVNLGGTLRVLLAGGFDPAAGSFFDVFTGFDIVEGAEVYELPTLAGGRSWEHAVVALDGGREALRLTVVQGASVPEPGSLALFALGAVALTAARRRR